MAYRFTKLEVKEMSFDDIMVEIFPDGLFTDSTLSTFWEKQKVDTTGKKSSDNLLDYPEAAKSITLN